MSGNYLHIEVKTAQCSKRAGQPCGDLVASDRSPAHTTLMCVDGIGSGTRARIAAQMCAKRLATSLQLDMTLRQAFTSVSETMNRWRDPSKPFAAFSVARIRNDGMTTVLCYDAPPPLLVGPSQASQLPSRPLPWGKVLVTETQCQLRPGEGPLMMSDGITQAGIGSRFPCGWDSDGVARFASGALVRGSRVPDIPDLVLKEARKIWETTGDDCTATLAYCRAGNGVADLYNLLSTADGVHIIHGTARNQVSDSVTFHQLGILARHNVLPLLVEKLRTQGKLVTLTQC